MQDKFVSAWHQRPKVSPTLRLTASYLAILMAVSIILSIPLYRSSTQVAEQGLRHERLYFEGSNPFSIGTDYGRIEQNQTEAIHRRLQSELLIINLLILVVGGGLSYYLARRTLKPIESALAAQSRFAADASHELRTPLTAMKSEIEVALRDKQLPISDARDLLGSNLEEVGKLEALAGGLLQLARHENEPLPLERVQLADVVTAATGRLAAAAERGRVTLETQSANGAARGHYESLVELAVILLDNAIKYSPAGATVTIATKRHGATIDLTVTDTGAGIAAADLPHIFERFYRADSSRSKITPGYGLGLSIAARIADLHHGSIDATSRLGHGARFTVHLQAAGPTNPSRPS